MTSDLDIEGLNRKKKEINNLKKKKNEDNSLVSLLNCSNLNSDIIFKNQ